MSLVIVVEYCDDDDDGDYTMSNSLWSFFYSADGSMLLCAFFSIIYKLGLTTHKQKTEGEKKRKKWAGANMNGIWMVKEQPRDNKMANKNQIWWYMKHKAMPISFMYETLSSSVAVLFFCCMPVLSADAYSVWVRSTFINANIR